MVKLREGKDNRSEPQNNASGNKNNKPGWHLISSFLDNECGYKSAVAAGLTLLSSGIGLLDWLLFVPTVSLYRLPSIMFSPRLLVSVYTTLKGLQQDFLIMAVAYQYLALVFAVMAVYDLFQYWKIDSNVLVSGLLLLVLFPVIWFPILFWPCIQWMGLAVSIAYFSTLVIYRYLVCFWSRTLPLKG